MRRSLLLCAFLCLMAALVVLLCLRGRNRTDASSGDGVALSQGEGVLAAEEPAVLEEYESSQEDEDAVPGERLSLSGRERGPFTILSSTPQETLLEFELPEYALEEIVDEEGVLHSRVELPGSMTRNALGAPQAPYYVVPYGTLPDARVTVDLQDAAYDFVDAEAPLAGTGPTWASDGRSVSEPQPMELANQETLWRSESYQLRGIQGVNVSLAPFFYDEEAGGYRVLTRGVVRIRSSAIQEPEADSQSDLATMQRHFFRNGESFRSVERASVGVLAVVVPDAWKEDDLLAQYVAWKKSLGWEVLVGAYPSDTRETASAIKAWIQEQYNQEGLTHLLLLGDSAMLPPFQHCTSKDDGDTAGLYSDQPYSFLAGNDSYGDILWGRIPVDSQAMLESRLAGYLEYERGDAWTDAGWTQKVVCLGSAESTDAWPYDGKMDQEIVGAQRQKLADAGIVNGGTLFWDPSTNSSLSCPRKVKESLENGTGTVLYLGHGAACVQFATTEFSTYNSYILNDPETGTWKRVECGALSLSMGSRAAFWMTPVCDVGNLDHAREGYADKSCRNNFSSWTNYRYSLGQALFQSPNSGLSATFAVVGGGATYWEPPMAQMESYCDDLAKSRGTERLGTQGAYAMDSLWESLRFCENYAQNYAKENAGNPSSSYDAKDGAYHVRSINFLGDPTAVVRQGLQSELSVQCALRFGGMTVTVSGLPESAGGENKAVRGAVAALVANGELDACRTDAQGQATLALSPYEASEASESEPLSIALRVLDGSGPYVEQRIPWLDKDADGTVSIQEYLDWQFLWHDAYPGDEASGDEAQALQAQARSLRKQFPATETIAENRGQLWTLNWSDSLASTLAGAGIPLVARDANAGTLRVRLNPSECVWLIEQGVFPISREDAVSSTPSRTVAQLCQRLAEMSKKGWPCFQLSHAGADNAGTKLPILRVAFGEESDSADRVRPQILFLSGLSGDEACAVEGLMAFLEKCWSAREASEDASDELSQTLRKCVLWVAPVWNPSGYDEGLSANDAGVELEWGYPLEPTPLAKGGAAGLSGDWSYPSIQGTLAAPPQPEQSALARWLARCQPDLILSLRWGDSCVAYAGDTAQALSESWKTACESLPAAQASQNRYPASGRFLEWSGAWLECPALELYLPKESCGNTAPAMLAALLKDLASKGRGGVVRDAATNEPIPYAWVSNGASQCTARADSRGRYYLPLASAGDCLFQAEGFSSATSELLEADSSAGAVCWMAPQENRLLPGVPQERSFQLRNLPENGCFRLEAPEGWTLERVLEEGDGDAAADIGKASNVLEVSWSESRESACVSVRIVSPSDSECAEVVLKGSVLVSESASWEGQWALPVPSCEKFELSLPAGWSAFSVPLEGVRAASLGAGALFRGEDGRIVPAAEELLLPGRGYFVCRETSGVLALSGAAPLEVRLPVEAGWQFLGVTSEHLPESTEGQYPVDRHAFRQLDAESLLAPGSARMRYLESPAVVFP